MKPMDSRDILADVELVTIAERVDRWTALMRVLIGHLEHLEAPPQLESLLNVAATYWSSATSQDDRDPKILEDLKVQCWTFLDTVPSHSHLEDSDTAFGRALLCVLEPAGSDDALADYAEWFATFVWGTG